MLQTIILKTLNSEEAIALAKSEIFHGLKKNGLVILNYDNKWFNFLKKIALKYTDKIIPFGVKKSVFTIFQRKRKVFVLNQKTLKLTLTHLPYHLAIKSY